MNNTVKKIVTISLACAFIVSGMTACGSKANKPEYEDTSRVLYTDEDTQTDEESDGEENEENSDESKSESGKSESGKNESGKDSSKASSKKDSSKTSSKKTSSKSTSSKAASSKSTASKKTTTATTPRTTTSRATAASSAAVSSKSDTSSKENTDIASDTDTASDTDKLSDTDTLTDTETDTENVTDTDTETETDTETDTDTEIEGSNPFDESVDLDLTYNGYVIKLGADMSEVLDNLGEATIVEDSAGGTIKTYYYNVDGFEIRAYTDDYEVTDESEFTVFSIKMDTAGYNVATDKNIAIGDTKQDMLSIYGSDYADMGDGYKYESSDGRSSLTFVFDGDIISEIIYSLDVTE